MHEELQAFGTSGGESLDDTEMATALVALRAVLRRLGVELDIPFRSFSTWRSYWLRQGASQNYQARRDLQQIFDPLHNRLVRLEEATFEALADPVSPRTKTVIETALNEEMTEHLGFEKHDPAGAGTGNIRNGTQAKSVLTESSGHVEIDARGIGPGASNRRPSASGSDVSRASMRSARTSPRSTARRCRRKPSRGSPTR